MGRLSKCKLEQTKCTTKQKKELPRIGDIQEANVTKYSIGGFRGSNKFWIGKCSQRTQKILLKLLKLIYSKMKLLSSLLKEILSLFLFAQPLLILHTWCTINRCCAN